MERQARERALERAELRDVDQKLASLLADSDAEITAWRPGAGHMTIFTALRLCPLVKR